MTWPDTCANTADEYLAAIALGPNEEEPRRLPMKNLSRSVTVLRMSAEEWISQ
jgi:hypothetical protein